MVKLSDTEAYSSMTQFLEHVKKIEHKQDRLELYDKVRGFLEGGQQWWDWQLIQFYEQVKEEFGSEGVRTHQFQATWGTIQQMYNSAKIRNLDVEGANRLVQDYVTKEFMDAVLIPLCTGPRDPNLPSSVSRIIAKAANTNRAICDLLQYASRHAIRRLSGLTDYYTGQNYLTPADFVGAWNDVTDLKRPTWGSTGSKMLTCSKKSTQSITSIFWDDETGVMWRAQPSNSAYRRVWREQVQRDQTKFICADERSEPKQSEPQKKKKKNDDDTAYHGRGPRPSRGAKPEGAYKDKSSDDEGETQETAPPPGATTIKKGSQVYWPKPSARDRSGLKEGAQEKKVDEMPETQEGETFVPEIALKENTKESFPAPGAERKTKRSKSKTEIESKQAADASAARAQLYKEIAQNLIRVQREAEARQSVTPGTEPQLPVQHKRQECPAGYADPLVVGVWQWVEDQVEVWRGSDQPSLRTLHEQWQSHLTALTTQDTIRAFQALRDGIVAQTNRGILHDKYVILYIQAITDMLLVLHRGQNQQTFAHMVERQVNVWRERWGNTLVHLVPGYYGRDGITMDINDFEHINPRSGQQNAGWLNDELIRFDLQMHTPNRPVVFNASWLDQHLRDPDNVPFPTLPTDHARRDWIVPLHWGTHWTLGYYNYARDEVAHLDSLGQPGDARDNEAMKRLNYMLQRIYPTRRATRNTTIRSAQQQNGIDCGMYVIENARDLAGGRAPGREIDGMQARAQLAQRVMNTALRIERENNPGLAGAEILNRMRGPERDLPFRYLQGVPGEVTDQRRDASRPNSRASSVSSVTSALSSLGKTPTPPPGLREIVGTTAAQSPGPRGRSRSRPVSGPPSPELGELLRRQARLATPPPSQPASQPPDPMVCAPEIKETPPPTPKR